MLDNKISDRIRQIVHAQDQAFTETLNTNCTAVITRLSAKGLAASGAAVKELHDDCRAILNDRSRYIWNTFKRVLLQLQVEWSAELAEDLKREMRAHLNENAGEANRVFRTRLPIPFPADQLPINEYYLMGTYNAEIDLLAAALKVNAERAVAAVESAKVQNNYSVGEGNLVILSGTNASAQVSYNGENQAALRVALENIVKALQESNLAEVQKRETLELTKECIGLTTGKDPNATKLRSQLRGIAEVVGGLANGTTLLTALYTAAQYMGLSL